MISEEELNKKIINFKRVNNGYDEIEMFRLAIKDNDILKINSLIKSMDNYTLNYIGVHEIVDCLILTGNAESIYNIATRISDINEIHRLENAIVETMDTRYICLFAQNIIGANIRRLQDAVLVIGKATGNGIDIYMFAKNVNGADKEKIEDSVIATRNLSLINDFSHSEINLYKSLNAIRLLDNSSKYVQIIENKIFLHDEGLRKIHCLKKIDALKYLIRNADEIKLRVYFDYLNNSNSTDEDLKRCDYEYLNYMCYLENAKSKSKVKTRMLTD